MTADRILRTIIACAILLGGCAPAAPQWPTADPAIDQAVATQMAERLTESPTTASVESTETAPAAAPIVVDSKSAPASLLAGLVVFSGTTIQYQADGSTKQLSGQQIEAVSPDFSQGLTNTNGDLWLQSFADQRTARLTLTETKVECCAVWWTNHPQKILMLSNTLGGNTGVATNGYLAVVKQDGTGYTVLDPDHPSSGRPAVSADGVWIAYGYGASGWLFGGELGLQEVKPVDYGLQSGGTLSAPAWSPDGKRLAWAWQDQAGMVSPLVLDLNAKSYLMAQTAVNEGSQIIGSLQWDPSGSWLVYAVKSTNSAVNGIWIMDTSTTQGRSERISDQNLITGVWSPDGSRLALASYTSTDPGSIWLLDLSAGKLQPVDVGSLAPAPLLVAWQ